MKYETKEQFEKVNVFGTGAPNDASLFLMKNTVSCDTEPDRHNRVKLQ